MAKGWLNNKTFMQIISLAIAIIIWLYVVVTQDPPRSNPVNSVEIICGLNQYQLNEGLTIISKSSDTVSFTANGKRSLVTGVKGTYYAKLNLENIKEPGKYNITPEISKPEGVTVSGVNPSVVEVYIDKYVSSLVPVYIKTKGELPKGMIITNMSSEVQQVSVTLPSLSLEQVSFIGLTVDLSAINDPTTINCTSVLYDNNDNPMLIKNATIDKKSVAVTVNAEKMKTVNIKPVINTDAVDMNGISTHYSPEAIDIYGESSIIDSIAQLETEPITLRDAHDLNREHNVNLILPAGIHLKDDVSKEVTIQFKK